VPFWDGPFWDTGWKKVIAFLRITSFFSPRIVPFPSARTRKQNRVKANRSKVLKLDGGNLIIINNFDNFAAVRFNAL
jgi:hypothetical protein